MQDQLLSSPWLIPAAAAAAVAVLAVLGLILFAPVYKHIICLRYLFSGWKAVVPLVSALPAALGVFLLILVFAIMDGFANETREMTRGTLSDIIVDAHMEGLPHYDDFARRIEAMPGVEAATPIIQTYAVARIKPHRAYNEAVEAIIKPLVRPCVILGIRPREKAEMGRFHQYLQRQKAPEGRPDLAALFPAEALLAVPPDWRRPADGPPRPGCIAGVGVVGIPLPQSVKEQVEEGVGLRVLLWTLSGAAVIAFLFIWGGSRRRPGHTGWRVATLAALAAAAGLAAAAFFLPTRMAEIRRSQVVDIPLIDYGGEMVVSTIPVRPHGGFDVGAGGVPMVSSKMFTLVDTFKSGYWEADSQHVYVDFAVAQQMAGMDAQPAGENRPAVAARANQVQIKLHDPRQSKELVARIRDAWRAFADEHPDIGLLTPSINTWEEQQRMILTVVEVEKNITALMLGMMFLGFVVLIALISYVMAYIKSRDVGILKAIGAPDAGVGSLFLGYGFIIGLIGMSLGMTGALLMLHYLDPIEIWVNATLGIDIFPREMYYFDHIPKHISAVWCVTVGASVLILSTLASMAGGLLAAMKQPVETLRYE